MNTQLLVLLLIFFSLWVAMGASLYLLSIYIAAIYQELQRRKSN